jgi:hypothetical protein
MGRIDGVAGTGGDFKSVDSILTETYIWNH